MHICHADTLAIIRPISQVCVKTVFLRLNSLRANSAERRDPKHARVTFTPPRA